MSQKANFDSQANSKLKSIYKKTFDAFVYVCFLAILIEVTVTVGLHFLKEYPIFNRSQNLYKRFYPYLENVNPNPNNYNILILGGSAISDDLPAQIGNQLQEKLKANFSNIEVFNIAKPAHNSRDNFLKLNFIKDKKFDLIIYYESINDIRQNCIPHVSFKKDYSHSSWYNEIEIVKRHEEFKWITTPFVFDLFKEKIKEKNGEKVMLNDDLDIKPDFLVYGDSVKTQIPFRENVDSLIKIGKVHNSKMLLLGYSTYIPKELYKQENFGFHKEGKFFKATGPRTTVGAWGYAKNIDKSIKKHNNILAELSKNHPNTIFYDMDSTMSLHRDEYFDICHFTKAGGKVFSDKLSDIITPIIKSSSKNTSKK